MYVCMYTQERTKSIKHRTRRRRTNGSSLPSKSCLMPKMWRSRRSNERELLVSCFMFHTHTHAHTHTHTHTYTHTHIHTHIHAHTHIYVRARAHTRTHTCRVEMETSRISSLETSLQKAEAEHKQAVTQAAARSEAISQYCHTAALQLQR
jgi:hypothetical protein